MRRLLALSIAALTIACDTASSGGGGTVVPAAEAYERPSAFEGKWLGESDGVMGTLMIERLGERRYYARFVDDTGAPRYVANVQQDRVPAGDDGIPGNLARFTWQDGRGSGGSGWLMINREDSAITGMLTHGASQRPGSLSFIRVDE